MKIIIAGEGPNELGSWAQHPSYRESPFPGVLEMLLERVRGDGWQVVDGILWKQIRKYRTGGHGSAEIRNVLGLVLQAKERGCDVVAFLRDRDGTNANPNIERAEAVEDGIRRARDELDKPPELVGGVVVKKLESWLVALLGTGGSETMRRPEEVLEKKDISLKSTLEYVAVVRNADMNSLPEDAASLRLWLERARAVLVS